MAVLHSTERLTRQLTLFHVYALATGATLSTGLFLLPGLAADAVGPAVVLVYLLAAVPLIPAMFSVVELATAMPRAGGAYYFLDRSLGPLAGTIGGLGTWLALVLKTAFALVGLGAYLTLFLDDVPYRLIACALAVVFGLVNFLGSAKTGRLQIAFVLGLLAILLWFGTAGAIEIEWSRFDGFLGAGRDRIIATAGVVYISYVGVTNVASVSEEVRDPERNLSRGLFLALGTSVVVYAGCILVMTGVVPAADLAGSLTPMAEAAERLFPKFGVVLVSVAALLAFSSVANAGILSASRYPLAMSRDHLLPRRMGQLSRRKTPVISIAMTVAAILLVLTFLDPLKIAKLASAFQLLVFALLCLAVIVMRESHLASYDPGYRSPWYPWMQIVGIVAPFVLITEMGWLPIVFSCGMIAAGTAWFWFYARRRVDRYGAIYHVFERLGRRRFEDLDRELRGILKEKGLREQDPFVEIVTRAPLIDTLEDQPFEKLVEQAADLLAVQVHRPAETLAEGFLEGTRIGATPVAKGTALPHLRLPNIDRPRLVLVRCRAGIRIDTGGLFGESRTPTTAFAIFFLVSPESDPGQHLRLLAELASRVDQEDFLDSWRVARDENELKAILLHHERYLSIALAPGDPTESLIDRAIREIELPAGCLVAVVRRGGEVIVPGGDTVLRAGDRLTVIGSEAAVRACAERFESEPHDSAGVDLPAS